jgi:hypothetical protein
MIERVDNPLPIKVSVGDINAKIKYSTYQLLEGTTTTICQIMMVNGFSVIGTSACVDPKEYNQALGEKYAYEAAFDKLWELEGYLLKQRRFEAGLP